MLPHRFRFVARLVALSLLAAAAPIAQAADGTALVFLSNREGGSFQLYRHVCGAATPNRVTAEPMEAADPALSPDGRHVAFVSQAGGRADLYVVELATGALRRVTDDAALEAAPVWSPDGKRLLYQSYADSTPKLYLIDAHGGPAQRLTRSHGQEQGGAFSPDGRQVVYAEFRHREDQVLMRVDLRNGQVRRLSADPTGGMDMHARWSPDGKRLAYIHFRGDTSQLFTVNADGSGRRALTVSVGRHSEPQWSPDGKQIAMLGLRPGQPRQGVYLVSLAGKTAEQRLFDGEEETLQLRWPKQGRELLLVRFGRSGGGRLYAGDLDGGGLRALPGGAGYDYEPQVATLSCLNPSLVEKTGDLPKKSTS